MRMKSFKRAAAVFLTLTLLAGCLAVSGVSVSAAENDPPQSEWEMTVPQIRVTTANGNGTTLQKEDGYQEATITITDTDGSVLSDACSFKVRGNTTALSWITKKAYTFKFAKKKDVLGMGKGKKWALIANAFDPTLLRNYTAFSLAQKMGLAYTSNFRFTELWVDGSFRGCYLLMEPIGEGKERVDIDIESNDGKNDFLMEYEVKREEDDVTYFTVDGLRFIASEPEEPTEEQLAYIQDNVQQIITAMRTLSREEIEAKIDVDSFARFYLLNELLKTFDFDMSSVFFYYKNGKLYAGPPWDYDLSAGNSHSEFGRRGSEAATVEGRFADSRNIYMYLCQNEWFIDAVTDVYRTYYDDIAAIYADGGFLDSARAQYADVFARNYGEAGWRASKWWINIQMKPLATYDDNFAYLKDWLRQRNEWMTASYQPFGAPVTVGDADGDGVITITDVTFVQNALAEHLPPEKVAEVAQRADVDGNGLSVEDATAIQRYLAEFPDTEPVGTQRAAAA